MLPFSRSTTRQLFIACLASFFSAATWASPLATSPAAPTSTPTLSSIDSLCREIGAKLGSVDTADCAGQQLVNGGGHSHQGRPLASKEYAPVEGRSPQGKVLLIGGIHGDEFSAVSIMFRWMETLNQHHSGLFHWSVVPLLNPDGLLRKKSQRQNHKGVDINRNFPTPDWDTLAQDYWVNRTYRNPRRFPGEAAASEPETRWLMERIKNFDPDAIIVVHAPHKLVDFDGPQQPPLKLGNLHLRRLGVYPGSLGNYGGVHLGIPVVTVELASAGIMPSKREISTMWTDLVRWLRKEIPTQQIAETDTDSGDEPADLAVGTTTAEVNALP